VLGDIEQQRGPAHARPGAEDDEVAALEPAKQRVEVGIAAGDAIEAAAGVPGRLRPGDDLP
jgi:hypothetical protein